MYDDIIVGQTLVFIEFCCTSTTEMRTMMSMKTINADSESGETVQLDRTINDKKPPMESGAVLIQNCIVYNGSNLFFSGTYVH